MQLGFVFREADLSDIAAMHVVRMSVKENVLSDPSLVKTSDYADHITSKGKGWLAVMDGTVAGFCIVDVWNSNVWALFVSPAFEGKGIGKRLQKMMLDWYFAQTDKPLGLSTDPASRAAVFYRLTGWNEKGIKENGEVLFEMSIDDYKRSMH